jgi:Uma2 family endonuclease
MTALPTTPPTSQSGRPAVPPLENGDRLTRAEFERRYRAMPGVKKAELIEGIVYMPSPVRLNRHGKPHLILGSWLGHYLSKTPGLDEFGDNATARLDEDNEPQPDLALLLPRRLGGLAQIDDDDYISGAPTWVGEIAASSVSIDVHTKLNVYRRNGVREYLIWRTEDQAVDWFALRDGRYEGLAADGNGILKSEQFPGLWLDVGALLKGDLAGLFKVVDEGAASSEHAGFVGRLKTS